MKLKKTILGMAVVAVAGTNVYLANEVRIEKDELSLLNLENIAEGQENRSSEDKYTCTEGKLDFGEEDCVKSEGSGYINGTYYSRIEYQDIFYFCDGFSKDACSPKNERHCSYGG